MQASWLKASEAIAFVSSVTARQAVGIHDGQLSAHGVGAITRWLTRTSRIPCLTLASGDTIL